MTVSKLLELLKDKSSKSLEADDLRKSRARLHIVEHKPILKKLFDLYYEAIVKNLKNDGLTVEVGGGGGFFKEKMKEALVSDILSFPGLDIVFDALHLPFKSGVVGNIAMKWVLHHISDPISFFKEAERVLKAGGRIVLFEPYISPFSYLIYRYIHFEHCDYSHCWSKHNKGPLLKNNQAIPTIIFKKCLSEFQEEFPQLRIIKRDYLSFLIYWLTGGYSYRALLPMRLLGFAIGVEKLLSPLRKFLASFMLVVIEKA